MRLLHTIIVVSAAVLILGGGYAYYQSTKSKETPVLSVPEGEHHTVVLSNGGFVPQELAIKRGDVVTFSTNRPYEYWPASDVHPTHNEYADFDPKRPLAPDETWSFQFVQEGSWAFHDHLNSTFTGTVVVTP